MNLRQLIPPSLLALTTAAALAQNLDLPYSSGSTGADGPFTIPTFAQPGQQGAMAYDSVRQECVYFGARNPSLLNATWVWNGQSWTLRTPATSPPARYGAAMAFDTVRGEVVLFGGNGAAGRLNDTWTWNGTTWTQKSPATSPSAREGVRMAWDGARSEMILFGGAGSSVFADTWAWNGSTWAQKSPATSPTAEQYHSMAYDGANQRVVLLGQSTVGGSTASFTWTWDGSTWANPSAGTPPGSPLRREGSVMTYSPQTGKCYLFGGGIALSGTYYDDTWEWNGATNLWTQVFSPRSPAARIHGAGAYDIARQEFVISHGITGTSYFSDTWAFKSGQWFGRAGTSFTFDLSSKPESIWNFTTINVPAGVSISFARNAANTAAPGPTTTVVVIAPPEAEAPDAEAPKAAAP